MADLLVRRTSLFDSRIPPPLRRRLRAVLESPSQETWEGEWPWRVGACPGPAHLGARAAVGALVAVTAPTRLPRASSSSRWRSRDGSSWSEPRCARIRALPLQPAWPRSRSHSLQLQVTRQSPPGASLRTRHRLAQVG